VGIDSEVGRRGATVLLHDPIVFGYGRLVSPVHQLVGLASYRALQKLSRDELKDYRVGIDVAQEYELQDAQGNPSSTIIFKRIPV